MRLIPPGKSGRGPAYWGTQFLYFLADCFVCSRFVLYDYDVVFPFVGDDEKNKIFNTRSLAVL